MTTKITIKVSCNDLNQSTPDLLTIQTDGPKAAQAVLNMLYGPEAGFGVTEAVRVGVKKDGLFVADCYNCGELLIGVGAAYACDDKHLRCRQCCDDYRADDDRGYRAGTRARLYRGNEADPYAAFLGTFTEPDLVDDFKAGGTVNEFCDDSEDVLDQICRWLRSASVGGSWGRRGANATIVTAICI